MSKSNDDSELEPARFVSSECRIGNRSFKVNLRGFANGGFADISEGQEERMGAISVSLKTNQGITSTKLVPDLRGGVFSQMVGELVAERKSGIAVVSLYLKQEIDSNITKTLLSEVRMLLTKKD